MHLRIHESKALLSDAGLRAGAAATVATATTFCLVALLLEQDAAVTTGVSPLWLGCLSVVAAAGLTVAWARPRNPIGWILLLSVLLQGLSLVTAGYAQIQYASGHPLPGSFLVASLAEWTWFPSLVVLAAVLPSLYPSGRAETTIRRWFVWAGTLGIVGICVELALVLGPSDLVPGLRLPYDVPEWVSIVLVAGSALALGVAIIGGLGFAFVRMLRATSPERQQLLWLLTAMVPYCVGYFVNLPGGGLVYAYVGVAVAVGVLRYRLLDIDLVIRKALFYGPLTVLVALAVATVSTVVARLAPSGPLPLLGAAAVVAVLVGPVTGWLRHSVDRFTLGDRADPLSAIRRVAARGGLATRDDALSSLLGALVEAVQVPYAAVVDDRGHTLSEVGQRTGRIDELELLAGGERLGSLVVGAPSDEPGRRIVAALVPHIATLLRTMRLAAEVELQRRRAISATSAERERIRSDLHDSLGPALSGIALGLQAVSTAIVGDEPVARAIVRRTTEEADAAVREVRRALDDLGPAALDRQRLDEAVRQAAELLGLDGARGPSFSCSIKVGTLPPDVAEVAYRIIGEALHNVAQHARATSCAVSLTNHDGFVHASIRDDGEGIGVAAQHGVGLQSMRRRAQAAGGRFEVCSRPEFGGTVVNFDLPLEIPT